MTKVPGMFDTEASFAGITLAVDRIDRKRSERSDNVMAMFHEEQPCMWEFVRRDLARAIKTVSGTIDFLDVGTGSGVWSILVTKHLRAENVLAIDKSCRAIRGARKNAVRNHVKFELRKEFYNMNSAPYKSCKSIGLYPPYHLYPKEREHQIPQHARGGIDGQQMFREQLVVANYHLADDGVIVFNQMCVGKDGKPQFVEYIPQLINGASLSYTNIFPPMETSDFLRYVYGNRYAAYQRDTAKRFPELYYCNGIIKRDYKSDIMRTGHKLDLKGRTWKSRMDLHRQIALHT